MNTKKLQLIFCVGGLVMEIGNALAAATIAQSSVKTKSNGAQSNGKTKAKNATSEIATQKFRKKSNPREPLVVTVDGGSAVGKSPITKDLSRKFNLIYVELGAIFRTVAFVLLKHGIDPKPENKQKIEDFLKTVSWKVTVRNRHACFIVDGEILSDKELRSDQLNATVALYSSQFESVHDFCLKVARTMLDFVKIDGFKGLIAEGRTCGTKIFPKADLKFWLEASKEAKINLRLNKEKEKDDPLQRDNLDKASPFAPLRKPEDAVRIWTHNRPLKGNIRLISAFIEQKFDEKDELAQSEKNKQKN
jgi:cytidylate kinase